MHESGKDCYLSDVDNFDCCKHIDCILNTVKSMNTNYEMNRGGIQNFQIRKR